MSQAPAWDNASWHEKSDNAFQGRLRRHQSWWRETELKLPAGNIPRRERPVSSMLSDDVDLSVNLWSAEARSAYERARKRLSSSGGAGLIQEDRLRRNLLSSQPLCFNLFGYLSSHPDALLPWVQSLCPKAATIDSVELEIAPVDGPLARSAFDAYVIYTSGTGGRGFLGIEVKYAEDLKKSQTCKASQKFLSATSVGGWKPSAADALDRTGLRQFWYNTLLAQHVRRDGGFDEGLSFVLARRDDVKARNAVDAVAEQLEDTSFIVFDSLEDVVDSVSGHDEWRSMFRRRYLDLELSA